MESVIIWRDPPVLSTKIFVAFFTIQILNLVFKTINQFFATHWTIIQNNIQISLLISIEWRDWDDITLCHLF